MKAVILAGGLGTRLTEETTLRPKPMAEIGGKPILWHIMKIYAAHGICDFIICLGYKGYFIKEFFANYILHMSDVTIDLGARTFEVHRAESEPWRVTLIDTGEKTQTGGRLKRIQSHLKEDEHFAMTYGDGLADIDITSEIAFHKGHGRLATLAGVRPGARFGALELDGTRVSAFHEKPVDEGRRINGGFFILSTQVFDLIEGDETVFEGEPLERLAASDQLRAFLHDGFWQPMDTLRDKMLLEEEWQSGKARWRVW